MTDVPDALLTRIRRALEGLGAIPALNPHLRVGMIETPASMLTDAWNLYLEMTPAEDRPSWAKDLGINNMPRRM